MAKAMRSIASSPTFRCDPFVRDEVFDHGRVPAPRLAALLMLPSALSTASASAFIALSRLNSSPHIIAVYASQRSLPPAPQHSLPGGRLHLTRAGLAPAGSRQLRGALTAATLPGNFRPTRRKGNIAAVTSFCGKQKPGSANAPRAILTKTLGRLIKSGQAE